MTRKLIYPLIIITTALAIGWGSTGHRIISKNIGYSLPVQMSFLTGWPDSLAAHSSDADKRKSSDPDEYPRHFIDIDYYSQFIINGNIIEDFDSLVSVFGYSVVLDQGTLPWTIVKTYDSLVSCFSRKDWRRAMLFASDLGHYVADAHMPLHITRNYNGQLTNQTGIHSRFESQMIGRYSGQIIYTNRDIDTIPDVSRYVFDFIYSNYDYVDSVLSADLYAKSFTGGAYTDLYYQKLWEYSKDFTGRLFSRASVTLSSLIYNAWLEAGSPLIVTSVASAETPAALNLMQNYPNPFNPETAIHFELGEDGRVTLRIYDLLGREVTTLVNTFLHKGGYHINFNAAQLTSGVYIYELKSGSNRIVKKMIYAK